VLDVLETGVMSESSAFLKQYTLITNTAKNSSDLQVELSRFYPLFSHCRE
jgi:hypothetical protein